MDITPEVGKINNDFSNPLFYKFLEYIDNFSCRSAQPLIVHSKDMQNTFLKRGFSSKLNFQILNNFLLKTKNKKEIFKKSNFDNNKLTIIYAGNIGRFQGLEKVVYAMSLITKIDDIELIIMGEGTNKQKLIDLSCS